MAPHVLSLQIGATNIPLSATDALLLDYVPQTAALSVTGQGTEVYESERQLVTESVRLWLYAATGALVQAKIAAIERFSEDVARRQRTRSGDRGYLYIQISSDTETWRSEIVSASVQAGYDGLRHWANNGVEVLLILTRRPYWETVAERELPLDNTSVGAKATGGVIIYNHDDATTGHDNWVTVAAVDVAGNLPAPLRLRLTNNTGGNVGSRNFYQASNAHFAPATFAHVIEGESMAWITQVVDSNSSAGYFGRATWTTLIAHAVDMFKWPLSSAVLTAAAGGFFRVLVRFANTPPTGIELQLHVKTSISPIFALWSGPKVTATGTLLQDMGVVQLPPGVAAGTYYDLLLVLTGEFTGTSQLDIDFLHLTPADSSRWFRQIGYQIPNLDAVENNGPEERVYEIDAGTGQLSYLYEVYNSTIYAWPNREQRLYFLHDGDTGGMNIAQTWSVRAWYRPRRNTL